jgi:hypothetical protein
MSNYRFIYGEGKENAFHRLQDEIDRRSSIYTQGSFTAIRVKLDG